ncbi:MAG: hypothetical protein Q8M16_12030 [Pirellulaceae bacterium]|nr:hypothetical protein [Pirellulaceae bacterium]
MSHPSSELRRWNGLPELYVLLAWWGVAAGIGWRLSWPNPETLGEFGLVSVGFGYVAALASFWVFGDPRGPLQTLPAWLTFLLIAFASSTGIFLIAANRTAPTSWAELEAIKELVVNAWPSRHAWNIALFRGVLSVAIPVSAWLVYGVFADSFRGWSSQYFREQMFARRTRLFLLGVTMLLMGYFYVRHQKHVMYPYATSAEVDWHAAVLRLALAIAIGQWLFLKILDMLRRPSSKLLVPLAMVWWPMLFEWKFRVLRQFLPIPGFGLNEYVLLANLLFGATIFATGFMLTLALAGRLPNHEPALTGRSETPESSMQRNPQVGRRYRLLWSVGLLWLACLGSVAWMQQYIEPGVFFGNRQNQWSDARVQGELRKYCEDQIMVRGKKAKGPRFFNLMSMGLNHGGRNDERVLHIDPKWALDPQLHTLIAKLKPNTFVVLIDTSSVNYSLAELLTLQTLGFRDLPPTTLAEWQQNPASAFGLYSPYSKIRDSHVDAGGLQQLGLLSNRHQFTRCTFSQDFLDALNPQTAAHFRFIDCRQTALLAADLASVDYEYVNLETAPLTIEDWRRITTKPYASVLIQNLPETLPNYLRIGERYFEVVFAEPEQN